jgi:hypothetical protein
MTRARKLARDIEELPSSEVAAFRKGFAEYDSVEWHEQIDRDAAPGKFGKLAERALAHHKAGRTKEL